MKFTIKRRERRTIWFAWYPVVVTDNESFVKWIWLEKVIRWGPINCMSSYSYEEITKGSIL